MHARPTLLQTGAPPTPPPTTPCPSSASFVNVPGLYTHAQAKDACAGYGYTLPMPKSFPLQFNLRGCLRNDDDDVFLGLTDSADEGTFMWDDGTNLSPTGYTNWFDGQPNNGAGFEEQE
jgi:hypothetical protein